MPNDERNQTRYEDMTPRGQLWLHRQEDGDICLMVTQCDYMGEYVSSSSIEFCTPISGGGESEHTWEALIKLFEAMKLDNEHREQRR